MTEPTAVPSDDLPEWTERDQMLAVIGQQIEALDAICETYSEVFGGSPGGYGRLEAIEHAWEAASRALDALSTLREQIKLGYRPR